MKSLKRVMAFILVFVMIYTSLTCCSLKITNASSNITTRRPINIGVLLYSFDDLYTSIIKKTLEDIQMKNEDNVKFTFYDGKNNQSIQEATINNLFKTGNVDILLVDLVNRSVESVKNVLDKATALGIPVVFNYLEPRAEDVIKSYNKAFVVDADNKQGGDLQGKIIIDIWNANKSSIDKNNDNILQYIMLRGSDQNIRPQYALAAINTKIKTEPLQIVNANFNKEFAKDAINSLFLKYDGKIEAIIADNDAMAIGAVEALQTYGYNTGDLSKTIVVVGIDGMPEAIELINKGEMEGTVSQDPRDTAEALYTVGMNLFSNKTPTEGTNYKLDKMGVTILLPYQEYTAGK
ncbi:galactose ABC transporter substrate-binding protein [Clostridium saccharoperbutylacetonicum]|uniref:galactose ABC transporter substrate-binding protein n=1 Tax=Clostridium saccharoperbutylacetonicum TaxID=36745 RepID=UPI000983BED6|nr:galactose ABC transporter substrate-binding protein [Clostridium saccharoperbutylacetonicum]AQR95648.1 D-galactose-binding periplasmic protein precursor [Clostridium saccharoperbutylacetonicum]NSB31511.1 methyl-galactoside transport system substrate-binding protein [Clostridium saccharoperbutylacetonicum]